MRLHNRHWVKELQKADSRWWIPSNKDSPSHWKSHLCNICPLEHCGGSGASIIIACTLASGFIRSSPINDGMRAAFGTTRAAWRAASGSTGDSISANASWANTSALPRLPTLALLSTTITQISIPFTQLFRTTATTTGHNTTIFAAPPIKIRVPDPPNHLVPLPEE